MSPLSTGELSFDDFVARMVQEYMKEQEMRERHRMALIKLREKAIKEKTQAELDWLDIKKK